MKALFFFLLLWQQYPILGGNTLEISYKICQWWVQKDFKGTLFNVFTGSNLSNKTARWASLCELLAWTLYMRVKQKTSKDLTLTKFWHGHMVGFSEHERNCLHIALLTWYVQQVLPSQHQITKQSSFLIKILRENYLRDTKMLVSATISSERNVDVIGNVAMWFFFF